MTRTGNRHGPAKGQALIVAQTLLLAACMASTPATPIFMPKHDPTWIGRGTIVHAMTELRGKQGTCAHASLDPYDSISSRAIETCLRVGTKGTLYDDEKTPFVITSVTDLANSHSADTGEWQVEASFNGTPMGKRMMSKHWPPELSCGVGGVAGHCESSSIDLTHWPEAFSPGTYTFTYTLAFDTSKVVVNTITLGTESTAVPSGPSAPRYAWPWTKSPSR
jgi:hypothetical protein